MSAVDPKEEIEVYRRILLASGLLPRAETVLKEERELKAKKAKQ